MADGRHGVVFRLGIRVWRRQLDIIKGQLRDVTRDLVRAEATRKLHIERHYYCGDKIKEYGVGGACRMHREVINFSCET